MKKKLCVLTLSACMLFSQSAWATNSAQTDQVDVPVSQEQIEVQSTSYPVGEDSGITIQKRNMDDIILNEGNYYDRYNQSIIVDSNHNMWTVYPTAKQLAENVQYGIEYDENDNFIYVDMENNLWVNNKKIISNVEEADENYALDADGVLYSNHTGEKILTEVKSWKIVSEKKGEYDYEDFLYALKEDNTLWKKSETSQFQEVKDNVKQLASWAYLEADGAITAFNDTWNHVDEKGSRLLDFDAVEAYYDTNGTLKYQYYGSWTKDTSNISGEIVDIVDGAGQAANSYYFLTENGDVYVPYNTTPFLKNIADIYEWRTWGTDGICFVGIDGSYYDHAGNKLGADSVLKEINPLQLKGNGDGTYSVVTEEGTEVLDYVVDLWRGGLVGDFCNIYVLRTDGTVWKIGSYGLGSDGIGTPEKVLDLTQTSTEPSVETGWIQDANGWKYAYEDGTYATNKWERIDNQWYWFNPDGYRATGWNLVKNKWYYMDADGIMQTGWASVDGKWYYLDANGAMQTGWVAVNGRWYYMNISGVMQTGWVAVKGSWYYLNASGAMQTGWAAINGNWYYLSASGAMQTGWVAVNGYWYYMDANGVMQADRWISGVYYVKSNGRMATSEWVDHHRYYVGANGAWVR